MMSVYITKMIKHKEIQLSTYSPRQLCDLVLDVEKYPEFLPWCSAARIHKVEKNIIIAELAINFKSFDSKYTSKIEFFIPEDKDAFHSIKVDLMEGPFKYLYNNWQFKRDLQKQITEVSFEIEFEFNSKILQKLMGLVFERALITMMNAFNDRAKIIYSKNSTNS